MRLEALLLVACAIAGFQKKNRANTGCRSLWWLPRPNPPMDPVPAIVVIAVITASARVSEQHPGQSEPLRRRRRAGSCYLSVIGRKWRI